MADKTYLVPRTDIEETGDKYILVLDMPGVAKDGVTVEAEGDNLRVTGKVAEQSGEGHWKDVRKEFELSDYRRDFSIGDRVKRDSIAAHYENGILRIELEKSDNVKPRKIEVKVA